LKYFVAYRVFHLLRLVLRGHSRGPLGGVGRDWGLAQIGWTVASAAARWDTSPYPFYRSIT